MKCEIIVRTSNSRIVAFLHTKRDQYISRMYDIRESTAIKADAFCKLGIIHSLLTDGEVGRIPEYLVQKHLTNGKLTLEAFDKCWEVIEDYNHTGGVNVAQRTDQTVGL